MWSGVKSNNVKCFPKFLLATHFRIGRNLRHTSNLWKGFNLMWWVWLFLSHQLINIFFVSDNSHAINREYYKRLSFFGFYAPQSKKTNLTQISGRKREQYVYCPLKYIKKTNQEEISGVKMGYLGIFRVF